MKTRTALYIEPALLAAIDARVDGVYTPSRNVFIVRAIDRALSVRVIALPIAAYGHNGAAGIHLSLKGAEPDAALCMIAMAREEAENRGHDTVFTYS